MTTLTSRLGLKKHTTGDRFKIADYTDNWNILDGVPGTFICTSTTRPTDWNASDEGRAIYETNTGLTYVWDGAAFQRRWGRGLMARAERLTPFSTTSTTYASVVATASATYSARRHLVIVEAPIVYSTEGVTGLAIFRGTTMLQEWVHQGHTGATPSVHPRGMSFVTTDAWAGGAEVYSLQAKAVVGYGGTCYVEGATNKPCAITVVEV